MQRDCEVIAISRHRAYLLTYDSIVWLCWFVLYHKPQVSCRPARNVTFCLNDRCILMQYPSWSAKGFGEVIELLIAMGEVTGRWHVAFSF